MGYHQPGIALPPGLPPLRLASRSKQEYCGACPFCGGDHRSDRFRVWLDERRYWCRQCRCAGWIDELTGERRRARPIVRRPRHTRAAPPAPSPADVAAYRQLYTAVALWGHANLRQEHNPEPLAYVRGRGLDDDAIGAALLGYGLRDPEALPTYLRAEHPDLLAHAEAAGVLVRQGDQLLTHPNLRGAIILPYIADAQVVDLRSRTFPGKGYRSLAGGYEARGAIFPFGWDALDSADTVLITEGEFKALAAQQAYRDGLLDAPALAHPGLSYMRELWATELHARGVRTVILAYDSQARPVKDGLAQLAPEEIWSVQHGRRLAAAGLGVRVLRLPLDAGEDKADLDAYLAAYGPTRLQQLIDAAPALDDYQRSLPQGLLRQAKLPLPGGYPTRRARPQRVPTAAPTPATSADALTLAAARAQIITLARDHALHGQGFLALAHPPGTGKGYGVTRALRDYLQAAAAPGRIVWTALRKDQLADQQGLALIPIHGRNPGNCRRFGEAQALTARGYSVTHALCLHRCPFVDHCTYRQQLRQDGDLFAPQPLLQATNWWAEAGVIVLDEFDPGLLARTVTLDSADLARIGRGTDEPHAHTVLGWLMQLLGTSADRQIAGATLLGELSDLARGAGLDLDHSLRAAIDALPSQEEVHRLPGLPSGAQLAEYETLPPNHLETLLTRLAHERRRVLMGRRFTSRLEIGGGLLRLYLRAEHLIQALSRPDQPKLILDATVSAGLLRALFPATPIQLAQPAIVGGATVVQVVSRDWAKSTLRGRRREQWYDAVAASIRPGRPTLVVSTKACRDDLQAALRARGHANVAVAHYGALRGSNAYKGHDVILSQVYHPNLDAIAREGRALFADEETPLDERLITIERTLTDASGASWQVEVPTFADPRLAALLEQRREAELVQAALRGRPFDHPESQITLMFGLPLPQLPPTITREDPASPLSNAGRAATARNHLATTAQQLLDNGARLISVEDLAGASGRSVVTVRAHLPAIAGRQRLRLVQQRRTVALPKGGQRAYQRWVLMRRGRHVPPPTARPPADDPPEVDAGMDQARNKDLIIRLIRAPTWLVRQQHRRRQAAVNRPRPRRTAAPTRAEHEAAGEPHVPRRC